jgi:hypothetical protein
MPARVQPAVSSAEDQARRFGRRRRAGLFAGAGLVAIGALVIVVGPVDPVAVAFTLGLGGMAILDNLLSAVTFTNDGVRLTGLRLPSKLRYDDIANASLGETSYAVIVKTVELIPTHGRRLRLVPYQFSGFYGPEGWAALLIKVFESRGIAAEPELMSHLARAASSSEVAVPGQQQGYEEGKQEPPISF